MRVGHWAWLLCGLTPFLAGCAGFWQNPNSTSNSFTLSNSGNFSVSPGNSATATITVTPANSFTGTVSLSCSVTTSPASATSPATCSLASTSLSISSTSAVTSTLTVATTSTTTTGAYNITVTGTSGSISKTTTLCADVSTSSGTCTAATASGVFYVLNQTTNQVAAMSISSSANLTTIGSVSLPTPTAIAVAPNGDFLYVSNTAGIYLYTIGSTGALTIGNGGVAISSDPAIAMTVDATNTWLVDADTGSSQLSAIKINSSTGALASAGESEQQFSGGLPANTPKQLAISPGDSSSCANCYVFVAMGSGGTELIHFNPSSANPFGTAYHLNVANALGGASTVAVDPSNRLVYIGETEAFPSATQSGGLRALTVGSTGITEISGSPYSTGGVGPSSILPSADGNYVYVANQSVSGSANDAVTSYSVTTSALTAIATISAGPTGVMSLAEDSTGSYLLSADAAGNPDLDAYTTNAGALTSALTGTTGTDPVGAVAIAAKP